MKIISLFIIVTVMLFLAGTAAASPQEDGKNTDGKEYSRSIDYIVGLSFSYNRADIEFENGGPENTLLYSFLALEVDVDLMDYLTVGFVAGYNSNRFDEPADFLNLPLSLRYDDESFKSMVFGVHARSRFAAWNDFSFEAAGEFLLFKKFENERDILLPAVSGKAKIKNSFSQASLELLIKYGGFETVTVFAGPQVNLINGEAEASETIESLEGNEVMEFKQKSLFGLTGGVQFNLGNHFDVVVKAAFLSKTTLSATLFYVF